MRRQLGMFAAMAALISMQGQQARAAAANSISYEKGVTLPKAQTKLKKVTPDANGSNPYKHTRTPKHNQRQYRKWLRQNPHMRNSKKVK